MNGYSKRIFAGGSPWWLALDPRFPLDRNKNNGQFLFPILAGQHIGWAIVIPLEIARHDDFIIQNTGIIERIRNFIDIIPVAQA